MEQAIRNTFEKMEIVEVVGGMMSSVIYEFNEPKKIDGSDERIKQWRNFYDDDLLDEYWGAGYHACYKQIMSEGGFRKRNYLKVYMGPQLIDVEITQNFPIKKEYLDKIVKKLEKEQEWIPDGINRLEKMYSDEQEIQEELKKPIVAEKITKAIKINFINYGINQNPDKKGHAYISNLGKATDAKLNEVIKKFVPAEYSLEKYHLNSLRRKIEDKKKEIERNITLLINNILVCQQQIIDYKITLADAGRGKWFIEKTTKRLKFELKQ